MEPIPNQLPHDIELRDVALPPSAYDPFGRDFPSDGMTVEQIIDMLGFDAEGLQRDLAEGKFPGVDPNATRFNLAEVEAISDYYDVVEEAEARKWYEATYGPLPEDEPEEEPEHDPFAQHFPPEGMTLQYMIDLLDFDAERLKRDLAAGKIPGVDPQATRFDRAAVDTICDFYDSDFDDMGEWTKAFRGRDPKELEALRWHIEHGTE